MSAVHAETRSRRSRWSSRVSLLVAGGVAAGVLAGAAGAQDGLPAPSSSAVGQYAELVPTGKGPTAPGLQEAQAASLSPTAQAALNDISPGAARALATIATSSDYGAPATSSGTPGAATGGSSGGGTSLDRTFEAAATAASPISDADLIGLLLTLLVVTAGGAALALQARAR